MKVLVKGWYGHQNAGDELFITAFQHLFPNILFTFTDKITKDNLSNQDAVFIGGGSFLGEPLNIDSAETFRELKTKKIFYIGVGSETNLDPAHKELLQLAQLIAIRNEANLEFLRFLNPRIMVIPDLILSLMPSLSPVKLNKSILVIPNISVVPHWKSAHWQHSAWQYFKSEFCQFLDELISEKYRVDFLPFCISPTLNDSYASAEIMNGMSSRKGRLLPHSQDLNSLTETISQYDLVITQRFHGAILSQLCHIPCLTIYHHDKLKHVTGDKLSYYGVCKSQLNQHFNFIKSDNKASILRIDSNIFIELQQLILNLLAG